MLIRPVVELERGDTALAQMLLIAQDGAVAETDREANQPSPTCLAWNDVRDSAKRRARRIAPRPA
jgi:hypothetical protein